MGVALFATPCCSFCNGGVAVFAAGIGLISMTPAACSSCSPATIVWADPPSSRCSFRALVSHWPGCTLMRCPSLSATVCVACCDFIARYTQSRKPCGESFHKGDCCTRGETRRPQSRTVLLDFPESQANRIERERDGHFRAAAILRQSALDRRIRLWRRDDLPHREQEIAVLFVRHNLARFRALPDPRLVCRRDWPARRRRRSFPQLSSELLETDRRFRSSFVCGSSTAGAHKTAVINKHGHRRHGADLAHQVFHRSLNLRETDGAAIKEEQVLVAANEGLDVKRVSAGCHLHRIVRAAEVHPQRATDELRARHLQVAHEHGGLGPLQHHLVHDGARQERLTAARACENAEQFARLKSSRSSPRRSGTLAGAHTSSSADNTCGSTPSALARSRTVRGLRGRSPRSSRARRFR
jgi:hypothetical protein